MNLRLKGGLSNTPRGLSPRKTDWSLGNGPKGGRKHAACKRASGFRAGGFRFEGLASYPRTSKGRARRHLASKSVVFSKQSAGCLPQRESAHARRTRGRARESKRGREGERERGRGGEREGDEGRERERGERGRGERERERVRHTDRQGETQRERERVGKCVSTSVVSVSVATSLLQRRQSTNNKGALPAGGQGQPHW